MLAENNGPSALAAGDGAATPGAYGERGDHERELVARTDEFLPIGMDPVEFRTQEDGEWSSNWISDRVEPGDTFDMDFGTDKGNCTVRTQIRFTDGSYFDANVNYCNVGTLYIFDHRLTAD